MSARESSTPTTPISDDPIPTPNFSDFFEVSASTNEADRVPNSTHLKSTPPALPNFDESQDLIFFDEPLAQSNFECHPVLVVSGYVPSLEDFLIFAIPHRIF